MTSLNLLGHDQSFEIYLIFLFTESLKNMASEAGDNIADKASAAKKCAGEQADKVSDSAKKTKDNAQSGAKDARKKAGEFIGGAN